MIFSGIFLAVALIHALVIWVNYLCAEFGITNQRVIVKEGFLKRKTIEVFLKNVESVQVTKTSGAAYSISALLLYRVLGESLIHSV